MAYTTVIAALAASKRATAGNTIFAEWGAAAQTDIEYLALNSILKDGSTSMTGTLNTLVVQPVTDLVSNLGDPAKRWQTSYTNTPIYYNGIQYGSTIMFNGQQLINCTGFSADATARKLVVDINSHKYLQIYNPAGFSLGVGTNTIVANYPITQPGTGIRPYGSLDLGANAPDMSLINFATGAFSTTTINMYVYNGTAGSLAGCQASFIIATTQ